jgi:hypothetical protein
MGRHRGEMAELPGDPREHMDALLRVLLPFAQQSLDDYGTFYPFGASMAPDGEVEALIGDTGEERPSAADVLDLLHDRLRSQADSGGLLAAAIATDVRIPEGDWPEGIRVEIEHRDTDPITCVLPYRQAGERYDYGALVAFTGARRTWD